MQESHHIYQLLYAVLNLNSFHIPVLSEKIIEHLHLKKSQTTIFDCTIGEGGITKEIIKHTNNVKVIGIDTDFQILNLAMNNLRNYKQINYIHDNYSNINKIAKDQQIKDIDNIIFDFGLSNFHLQDLKRGFSYKSDSKLDMRFDTQNSSLTAYEVINKYSKEKLIQILSLNADFPINNNSKKFIDHIIKNRPINNGETLMTVCKSFFKKVPYKNLIKIITRVFQAIRIEVNQEFENIKLGLKSSLEIIGINGRIFALTYHSSEDRLVKNIFKEYQKSIYKDKKFNLVNKKVIKPEYKEQMGNPSSRSAKLRIIERLA